jgi:S1-C subfamily serine protease
MKFVAAVAVALLLPSLAVAQDKQEDERVKRIVDRIEKEIRESHEKTREEIRAIIRAEIQKSQGKTAPATAPEAKPSRKVFLGISADDLTEADRKALGSATAVKVSEVRGPAKDAGIQPGDLLVEFDGQAVSEDKLGEILSRHQPGDAVAATVLRSQKRVTVKIVLAERKD